MTKVAIIHFMPLEFYPPTTNFLNIISSEKDIRTRVWSTHNNKKRNVYCNNDIEKITRTSLPSNNENRILRFLKYFFFNLKCFIGLCLFNPQKVVYYETFSAWPIFLYHKLFGNKFQLYIHFHEYFSPKWYENGMQLVKYYHSLEKKYLFHKADWISQTNRDRLKFFLKDNKDLDKLKLHLFPNYPPKEWIKESKAPKKTIPIRTVYIGTLSLDYSYIVEYCNWVKKMDGKVIFHIYGYNYNEETLEYLKSLKSAFIKFFEGGIDYYSIPQTLRKYDFGLILYKAITDNYKYNESNKLFEYLVCNLSVLYSDKMLGIRGYDINCVKPLDFDNLEKLNIEELILMKNINNKIQFTADNASRELVEKIKN